MIVHDYDVILSKGLRWRSHCLCGGNLIQLMPSESGAESTQARQAQGQKRRSPHYRDLAAIRQLKFRIISDQHSICEKYVITSTLCRNLFLGAYGARCHRVSDLLGLARESFPCRAFHEFFVFSGIQSLLRKRKLLQKENAPQPPTFRAVKCRSQFCLITRLYLIT